MSTLAAVAQWTRNLSDSVWTASLSDQTAFVEHRTGRAYKYAELRDAVHRFAAALVRRVHTPSEVVALVCDNSAEFIVAYHGTLWQVGSYCHWSRSAACTNGNMFSPDARHATS
ncbi:AMP-binding protein [Saccharopolyspora sp. ASAGF58]|uniref:AMP-binding protein n=1 Tax=Saccharopolyspora sp. ASAGF58 TaxID=2719023 RepID=UPI0014400977|nr:AMP-binding protein [Saccharopolyspora sp. ASAGF58]QIZ34089.1 4-coumarate--CoA ligase family protein [Saccharopolyspora sp. ASAGF58]